MRALAVDVEKNLRAPLAGIRLAAERLGIEVHEPTVGMRTGDTSADERRRLVRYPADILITTPESLYLMLTSQARETLRNVEAVIVDEIHSVAATKRGAHLALTLERLDALLRSSRRNASACRRHNAPSTRSRASSADATTTAIRAMVTIVDAGVRKPLEVEVIVPVDDMGALGEVIDEPVSGPAAAGPMRRSIWPSMHPRLLELVESHRSTLIFVNARRLAERLATRLNELAAERDRPDEHGGRAGRRAARPTSNWSRPTTARCRESDGCNWKTSSSRGGCAVSCARPRSSSASTWAPSISSSKSSRPDPSPPVLQRIGRAGHQVGEPSTGKLFPKHRADLVEASVVVRRMQDGLIEHTRYPRNPLDVLAQQIVAMCALDEWKVDELAALVRRAANFAELSDEVFTSVLDLLAGRYPSDEFAELRPRIVWDRVNGIVRGRAGAQRLAVTSGGTIPDRGSVRRLPSRRHPGRRARRRDGVRVASR